MNAAARAVSTHRCTLPFDCEELDPRARGSDERNREWCRAVEGTWIHDAGLARDKVACLVGVSMKKPRHSIGDLAIKGIGVIAVHETNRLTLHGYVPCWMVHDNAKRLRVLVEIGWIVAVSKTDMRVESSECIEAARVFKIAAVHEAVCPARDKKFDCASRARDLAVAIAQEPNASELRIAWRARARFHPPRVRTLTTIYPMTLTDQSPSHFVTRFAPSPSGHLHVGGARTALFCWAFAKGRGGKFVLRIEDTDQKRSSDAASIGFVKDLLWLGIDFDEGPQYEGQGGGPHGPYFQAQRLDIYQRYFDQLLASGDAYYAFESADELAALRAEAKARNEPFRYTGVQARAIPPVEVKRRLDAGEPAVIRFHTRPGPITIHDEVLGDATLPDGEVDDFVIRKADGFPTYHFAVVVDDELMGVTHVLRAQEHFNNSAKHIVLQDALKFRRPVYGHLPLIFNPDGSKMSKRDKDKVLRKAVSEKGMTTPPAGTIEPAVFSAWLKDKNTQLDLESAQTLAQAIGAILPEINVDDFRKSGYLPEVICNFLALNGWSPGGDVEKFDREFLKQKFDLSRVVKTAAKFDRTKLLAFNLDAIQAMPRCEFVARTAAHGRELHPDFMAKLTDAQFQSLCDASQERSKTLDDLFRTNLFITTADDDLAWDAKAIAKCIVGGEPAGAVHLKAAREILQGCDDWTVAGLEVALKPYAETLGNVGKLAQPLRVAVCGATVSPPIYDTLAILGKQSTLRRIDRCLTTL